MKLETLHQWEIQLFNE